MELDTESEVNFLKFNDNNWSFSRIEMLRFVGKIVVQDRPIISLVDFSVQMINKVKKKITRMSEDASLFKLDFHVHHE